MSETIELYDSEIPRVVKLQNDLQEKYGTRPPTKANLTSLVHETEDRFREIGLEVEVFLGKRILAEAFGITPDLLHDPDGTLPVDFTVSIVARTDEQPFDHERMKREVDQDLAGEWWERYKKRATPAQKPGGGEHGHEH